MTAIAKPTNLSQLRALQNTERKQLSSLAAQEQKVIEAFWNKPSLAGFGDALGKALSLEFKQQAVRDQFDPVITAAQKSLRNTPSQPTPAPHTPAKPTPTTPSQPAHHAPAHHPTHTAPKYGQPWKPGTGGQLQGSDTSHYQSKSTFEHAIAGSQFAAIKATEGTGYVDPTFKARWAELGKKIDQGKMSLRVAYLFLDKGNGVGQAKHFLNTLGIHGKLKPGTRLALDWEASALSSPQTLKDAANYIHKVTGLWPMVYTSASQVGRARAAVPNAPMWEAKWSGGRAVKNVPFVQYSDGPGYDHDVFNGSKAALRKFAGF